MAWQEFNFKGRSALPKVSVSKSGVFGFNNAAKEKYSLAKAKSVKLFIDKDAHKIGFAFFATEEPAAKKLRSSALISGRKFIQYHQLEKLKGQRFECALEGDKITITYDVIEEDIL